MRRRRRRDTLAPNDTSATAPPPPVHRAWLELALADAAHHGTVSDPDHEVGDLQALARLMWSHMDPAGRARVVAEWRGWDWPDPDPDPDPDPAGSVSTGGQGPAGG